MLLKLEPVQLLVEFVGNGLALKIFIQFVFPVWEATLRNVTQFSMVRNRPSDMIIPSLGIEKIGNL